jgi:hypothetical protein
MNVLTDFHHNSLLRSLVLLFEGRLGMQVYRPIGLEWFYEGYWAINDQLSTAKQFLDFECQIMPDNTPPLNVVKEQSDGIYSVYDPGNITIHNAITLESFKSRKFDYIIASIPQHIPLFQKLIQEFQPQAKLIIQIGNNWNPNIFRGLNVLGSVKPGNIQDANVVYYHQEFDTNLFKPKTHTQSNTISSYINILQELTIGWRDFTDLENSLQEFSFKSYGGQCRDGSIAGAEVLADSMNNDDLIFHVKDHGDGYGHIIYNAYACGRPTIIRRSGYDNQLAQELFNAESSINLDGLSVEDAVKKIRKVLTDSEILESMSVKAYETFKNNVDFAYDAEKVYNWMATL